MRKNCLLVFKRIPVLFLVICTMATTVFSQAGHSINNSLSFVSFPLPRIMEDETGNNKNYSGSVKSESPALVKKPVKEKISFMPTSFRYPSNARADIGIAYYNPKQLILYAKLLKELAVKKGYDTSYVFLCNMGLVSNKKRFFVFNLTTMRIENAGLVAQGRGNGLSIYDKKYSNEPGSNCTALGRYKVSGRYSGEYGESFKLFGLDSTNNKAYARRIVLHSMPCIPDTDAAMPPCASEGCPAVSTSFLESLKEIISSAKKPILMWIFDSNLQELVVEEQE